MIIITQMSSQSLMSTVIQVKETRGQKEISLTNKNLGLCFFFDQEI